MNNRIILISLIGGLVAGLLVNYVSRKAPNDPIPSTDQSESKYYRGKLIIVASAFVVIAWFSIIGSFVTLCLGLIGMISDNKVPIFVGWLIALLASAGCYMAICPFLKCESCGRSVTVQWTKESPPFAKKIWGMDGWASTILQVLLTRKFTCMYCGKDYSVTETDSPTRE